MQIKSFMFDMIRFELEDAVGKENVSTNQSEIHTYSVDYFWLSRMWQDKGGDGPTPDIIVRPGTSEEVSRVLKIANYIKFRFIPGAGDLVHRAARCLWQAVSCWI